MSWIDNHVVLNHRANFNGCGRSGTAVATRKQLLDLLGKPHLNGCDEKTTAEWYFTTTRGTATLHDYWWNQPTEWSIGARDIRAARWLAKWLRSKGIVATAGPAPFGVLKDRKIARALESAWKEALS